MYKINFHAIFLYLCKIIEVIVYEKEGGNIILQQNKLLSTNEFKGQPYHSLELSYACRGRKISFLLCFSKFSAWAPVTEDKFTREKYTNLFNISFT